MSRPIITQEVIQALIDTNRAHRRDTIAPAKRLEAQLITVTGQPKVEYKLKSTDHIDNGYEPIEFNSSAMAQMLSKLNVRTDFYSRCPAHLQEQIFNWFAGHSKTECLLRLDPKKDMALPENAGKPTTIRAALTTLYGIVDDHELFPLIIEAIEGQNAGFVEFRHDEKVTQMVVEFPDTEVIHEGVTYIGGLVITNSETGHSSVWVEPFVRAGSAEYVNRESLQKQGVQCRFVHRGKQPHITGYVNEIKKLAERAKDISQVGITQLLQQITEAIPTEHALAIAKAVDGMPRRFLDILEEEWEDIQAVTRFNVAKRIIELAKDLPLFQRIQVEQGAGKVVKLFDGFQARMDEIMEDLNGQEV